MLARYPSTPPVAFADVPASRPGQLLAVGHDPSPAAELLEHRAGAVGYRLFGGERG